VGVYIWPLISLNPHQSISFPSANSPYPSYHTMPTPTDKFTQAPSTRNSQHVDDDVTTNKAPSTSKEQSSHPASNGTQQTIARWKRVSLLAKGLSDELSRERSGHLSFADDWKQKMNEEVAAMDNKEKKRVESAMLVRIMLFIRATGRIC
jgi:hypothetical protein